MEKRIDYELEKEMDRAIMLLARAFDASGHNAKPVILHSIRVGMALFNAGYGKTVVLAGLLHDLLEDTDITARELEAHFGEELTRVVEAVSFDPEIRSKREQNEDVFRRCRAYGFDALAVKCADIADNIDYFVPTPGYEELAQILLEKYHSFLLTAEPVLLGEPMLDTLKAKVARADALMEAFLARD